MASSVARDTDEEALLTHLILWRYLPIERPQTFRSEVHHQVSDDRGARQMALNFNGFYVGTVHCDY